MQSYLWILLFFNTACNRYSKILIENKKRMVTLLCEKSSSWRSVHFSWGQYTGPTHKIDLKEVSKIFKKYSVLTFWRDNNTLGATKRWAWRWLLESVILFFFHVDLSYDVQIKFCFELQTDITSHIFNCFREN